MKHCIVVFIFILPLVGLSQSEDNRVNMNGRTYNMVKDTFDVKNKKWITEITKIVDSTYSTWSYLYPNKGVTVNMEKDIYISYTLNRNNIRGYSLEIGGNFKGVSSKTNSPNNSFEIVFSNDEIMKFDLGYSSFGQSVYVVYNINFTINLTKQQVDKISSNSISKIIFRTKSNDNGECEVGEISLTGVSRNDQLKNSINDLINSTKHFDKVEVKLLPIKSVNNTSDNKSSLKKKG